jgi:hypothetical protein
LKHIIPINEFFQDVGVFGDTYGYGGANGVFKVTYKPYKDLSVTVGPDPDVPRYKKGSQFHVGDYVSAKPINSKKTIGGLIVKTVLSSDGKNYKYFVQIKTKNKKEEQVVEVVPSTIKFLEGGDRGFKQKAARFNMDAADGDAYNSPYVYNNNVGGEQVDGS